MKKTFIRNALLFAFICLFYTNIFAIPLENVKEYTLENGLTVFILQDNSTPLIHLEYTVRAGFSNQTKENSGFFKLYTRIFETACTSLDFDTAECNADSSRYILTTLPSKLEQTSAKLAQAAFSLSYSDDILAARLNELKDEVKEEAASASGFINSAIDSRVFSAAPWKHDSGVYPALFTKTSLEKARNLLNTIAERYYTPQNSALFISGNIDENNILALIEKSFGQYYSSYSPPLSKKSLPVNQQRKFVLHSPDFSADMTQVVMQYTILNMEESQLAAILLNNDASSFKYKLVNRADLNIPGNEYINAAAAHKKDSSRLIIQSLLQKSQDKNSSAVNSLEQAEAFVNQVKAGITEISPLEYYAAQQAAIANLSMLNSSSTDFMTNLAAYWALEQYDSFDEEVFDSALISTTAANLFSRSQKLAAIDYNFLLNKLDSEEAFVFVIINSADYKKNKAKYTAAGYEEINAGNAAWYNQAIFKDSQDPLADDILTAEKNMLDTTNTNLYSKDFYRENISLIKESKLSNGIPLITKENNNSGDITILLSVRGGKLNSADNNGYEEVMLYLLASNIQKEITKKQGEALILGDPLVDYDIAITTGIVTIECSPYDFSACCKAISDAIIYSDILPAQADRAVSTVQYKKRLENGSVARQMLYGVIKELYSKSDFPKIFDAKEEILTKTKYQNILEGYPALLDASRYSIIVTGLIPQNTAEVLENTMGLLTPRNSSQTLLTVQSKLKNSSTKKTVKLTHTFLTDIPAEKAGPMPSKLIPTTKFLDPVMYVFKLPQSGTKENALTLAALKEVEKLVQKKINLNPKLTQAQAQLQDLIANTDTIILTILNVDDQKEIDSIFRAAVAELNEKLNSKDYSQIVREIKDNWIQSFMTLTLTNTGTARLLQKGIEIQPYEPKPQYYLNEYNFIENAEREDFIEAMNNIPQQPLLRFYAK
ncbi:MAG: insulinase family protein [Treponema sp.]|nr:insulinase family protein [Treponema sp.]